MKGPRMEVTKGALILFLKSLPADAHFSIISFGGLQNFFFHKDRKGNRILKVKEESEGVQEFVQKFFEADLGGTEIAMPLSAAIQMASDSDGKALNITQTRIFLLTDGEVDDPNKVIEAVKQRPEHVRVHTFGLGSECDKDMVQKIAAFGGGSDYLIDKTEKLDPSVT